MRVFRFRGWRSNRTGVSGRLVASGHPTVIQLSYGKFFLSLHTSAGVASGEGVALASSLGTGRATDAHVVVPHQSGRDVVVGSGNGIGFAGGNFSGCVSKLGRGHELS